MDVGLALPQPDGEDQAGRRLGWDGVVALAMKAEELGLASLWVSDVPGARFEPLTLLAGLSRLTTTARLGTLSLDAGLRPPAVAAKALATVDVLSGGRLTVGLRPSSIEEVVGRSATGQLGETIQVLRGAFTGDPFTFHGRHVAVEDLRCRPPTRQQPAPPIWVMGGRETFEVVARHADGWGPGSTVGTVDEFRVLTADLDRTCEQAGRDPLSVHRCLRLQALVAEDEVDLRRRWERLPPLGRSKGGPSLDDYRRRGLVGTVGQVREQVAVWREAGVSTLVLDLGAIRFGVANADDLPLAVSAVS